MPAGVSAYTALANVTLGSTATSVTFSSISQAYRDLVFVLTGTTTATQAVTVRFNGDSGSNYFEVGMDGSGSSASSFTSTQTNIDVAALGTSQSQATFSVMDYSATDKHKTVLVRTDNASWGTRALAGRWGNTAAITSAVITMAGGQTFAAGSSFALYGVSA